MKTKICSKCRTEKLITDFHKCKYNKDGYNYWCKECINNYNRQRMKEGGEKAERKRKQIKEWYKNNVEKSRIYHIKWREDNPEKFKKQKERALIRLKQLYKDNPEKYKEIAKIYRSNNPEKMKEYHKRWRDKNKDKVRIRNKEYQKKTEKKT